MQWWDEQRDRIQWTFAQEGGAEVLAEKTVFPGSASQLLIASAALSKLGAGRRFVTRVLGQQKPDGQVQLTLVGGGDPTLQYRDMAVIAQRLYECGVREVCGPLWVDDTLFDDIRQGAGWFADEESEPHQAQLSALSVDGNCAVVKVKPATAAQAVDLGRAQGYLRLARGEHSGSLRVFRRRGSNVVEMAGHVDGAMGATVTVDDPALYAGHLFLQSLVEAGIAISGEKCPVHGNAGGDCLVEHRSALLIDILTQQRPGQGSPLVYELLLKHLGSLGWHQGSSQRGLSVVDELMAPIIGTSYRLMDGTGLSRYNLLSSDQLVALLSYVKMCQPELASLFPVGEHGRLIYTKGRSAAGVIGYWGTEGKPVALLAFGQLNNVSDPELLYAIECLLSAQTEAVAANRTRQVDKTSDGLIADLDRLLADPLLHRGLVGMHVVDIESGCELYTHMPDVAFTPASNTKLFTSAGALYHLGGHFRYQTPVYYRGQRYVDGAWNGDLVVKGVGDPTLDEDVLQKWAEKLVEQGLRILDGGVVVDSTAFVDGLLPCGWLSNLEKYGYSPQISALSTNENVVSVKLHPGRKVGDKAFIEQSTMPGYLTVENRVWTSAAGGEELVEFCRLPYMNNVTVTGEIPVDHEPVEIKITVEDPSIFFGKALIDALTTAGVRVRSDRSVASGVVSELDTLLFVHSSPPMSKIVASLNKPSDNFIAEMVLRSIGLMGGGVGSAEKSIELVHQMLRSGGVENLPILTDGSGLTRHNLITPRQVTTLLRQMASHPEFGTYYASLPIAGIDGTLANRMKSGYAYGNVRAKTGTMGGVSSLSGYLTTKSGRKLCFAILMNGFSEQGAFVSMQNLIAERLAGSNLND